MRALTAILAVAAVCLCTAGQAAARTLHAPGLQSPGNGASVEILPAFTWTGVAGAASYQFEFSADKDFSSAVQGFAEGPITLTTTAITNDKTIPNGTYYWRVRGLSAKDKVGRWSPIRTLHKEWNEQPVPLSPLGSTVNWPSQPALLQWTPVPHAYEYDVLVATDPAMSNLVYGSVSNPVSVQGPQFALPGVLAPGTYYWAIQPVDAEGYRGVRSAVETFNWAWPSTTSVSETDDSADPTVVEPQFNWTQIPGAASYELEVSRASDFPLGSDVLDVKGLLGASFTPTQIFPNETTLYWRVRALDINGDAGTWNIGQPFTETFDQTTPSIPNLHLVDQAGNVLATGSSVQNPIISWSRVPGASSYIVKVGQWTSGFGCDFSNSRNMTTPATAWTPVNNSPSTNWEPQGWPGPNGGITPGSSASPGAPWCVQVQAQRDDSTVDGVKVISNTTTLGTLTTPAFQYLSPTAVANNSPEPTPGATTYVDPGTNGSQPTTTSTPLLAWNPMLYATGYFVVLARDQNFTNVINVGFTTTTSYEPPISIQDETSSYWWEVIPTDWQGRVPDQSGVPADFAPQQFNKSSIPPTPLSPTNGATVQTQPTFSWSSAAGARNYTLQISGDPSFANPIDAPTTDSTSYTTSHTLPADTTLYWRVRANDANNTGLNWSAVSTFTHHLPAPSPSPFNATGGDSIPDLAWSSVTGATSYDMYIVQADGTTESFTFDTPEMTPGYWYGTGIWRWEIRADFPGGATSAYFSPPQSYLRVIPSPSGVQATKKGTRIIISWNSNPDAKQYTVQLSATDGFSSPVASDTTDNTVWVPQISAQQASEKLFWRVAVVDRGGNIGTYATGIFKAPHKPRHHRRRRRRRRRRH